MVKRIIICSIVVLALACNDQKYKLPIPDKDNGAISLPENFHALVVYDSLKTLSKKYHIDGKKILLVRDLTVSKEENIYVSYLKWEQPLDKGGVLVLQDTNKDGRVNCFDRFGRHGGTGITIRNGYLYFGADTAILRYKFNENSIIPDTAPEVIARGFLRPKGYQHFSKAFTFDEKENMYVTVGAPSNSCQESNTTPGSPGMFPCPFLEEYGGVWRFKDKVLDQVQMKDGYLFSTGIRHSRAIAYDPFNKKIYLLQHGTDQFSQCWPEHFTNEESAELPSEELFELRDGADYGWPYGYYDQIKGKKMVAPEYGGDGEKTCEPGKYDNPVLGFPGHLAPNDLLIYTGKMFPKYYRKGMFIAFHGSWNRAPLPQKGYFVVFVPFKHGKPTGKWEIFADGFAGVDVVNSPWDAKFRPTGLAQGPDGSLYVLDDQVGRIWRIIYKKK